jgi:AcrR family transcriptional regulator/DNA-binding MarR family transcriptional regulator
MAAAAMKACDTENGARRKRSVPAPPAPSRVSAIQRRRLLAAAAEVAVERGAGAVTVAHVVARSGVSRRTFYELFCDREECLLAALDQAIARVSAVVLAAYERGGGRWRERVRVALEALLVFFDDEPALAYMCLVGALEAGPRALERRTRVVRAAISAVDEGRGEARAGSNAPPLTAEGVVGAVLAVLHARLARPEREREPLAALTPALMSTIVHPYLGQRAAERELQRPSPRVGVRRRAQHVDPLDGLDMRLTYRTVRVLVAIAGRPGASNREVAAAAGIADQGQVSKLLARLQSLGLIYNRGEGAARGAANAWALTPRGRDVERTLRSDSDAPAPRHHDEL